MRIASCDIGPGFEPYVIAEIGVNHDGSPARAVRLVEIAAEAGADAVKTQFFRAESLMSGASRLAAYQLAAGERDPIEMLRRLELPLEAMHAVVEAAHGLGLHAITTVFSVELVAEVRSLAWDAFKSASPDIVHRPLLDAMAASELPMILSTGAATMDEVERAAAWMREAGAGSRTAMLQCVSSYPAPEGAAALGGVAHLARATGFPSGYSDHTEAVDTGALAVAAGACVLEKHLTYSRGAHGPDHRASLDGPGFAEYVRLARRAHTMLGGGVKRLQEVEADVRAVSRQSVVARRRIARGDPIGAADITFKRPGTGVPPWRAGEVIGAVAVRDIGADEPIGDADVRRETPAGALR